MEDFSIDKTDKEIEMTRANIKKFYSQFQRVLRQETELTLEEKKYLLCAERGDISGVKYYLEGASNFEYFNMNAVDPLGRSALYIAIEYENIEMIKMLLSFHVYVGEGLLHAINEEFVEAVEILLQYQDNHLQSEKYNSEKHDSSNVKISENFLNTSCRKNPV
jgi:transient receptor potential cation channel subfamily C protein 4